MSKVRSAVVWSALDVLFRSGFGFFVTIILARILAPEDFGVIAMLAIFVTSASLFVDGGFTQAIIQSQSVSHEDESSIFFFNLGMGALVALVLCLMAPWIASFYANPALYHITIAMAINLFVGAFGSVHNALLSKKLKFNIIAKIGGLATLFSGFLAVLAAVSGWGVWSLVVQILSATIVSVCLFWWMHAWRPRWYFRLSCIRKHFRFSGYLMISSFMNRVYGNVYAMVIGKMHTAQDAGFYAQAYGLQQLPIIVLTRVVSRVAFPVFSVSNDNKDKLISDFTKALAAVIFMSVPISFVMMLLAEPIVLFLFGEKWMPSVPVLQVLSAAAIIMPMQMINISLLKALGRTDLNVRVMFIKFISGLSLLFLAAPYGVVAIAWAFVLSNIINSFVNTYYIQLLLNFGLQKQLRVVRPYVLSAVPMVLVEILLQHYFELQGNVLLLFALPLMATFYLATCYLAKLEALSHFLAILKPNRLSVQ